MDRVAIGTVVHVSPSEAYEALLDLPQYAHHADYLQSVSVEGDGRVGTTYHLTFGWWKVRYSVVSEVTELEPPRRIAFELTSGLTADGEWVVEPAEVEATESAASITLSICYDPSTVADSAVRLPSFVSVEWVINRVAPFVEDEVERIVQRVVADIEGQARDVSLTIETD